MIYITSYKAGKKKPSSSSTNKKVQLIELIYEMVCRKVSSTGFNFVAFTIIHGCMLPAHLIQLNSNKLLPAGSNCHFFHYPTVFFVIPFLTWQLQFDSTHNARIIMNEHFPKLIIDSSLKLTFFSNLTVPTSCS